MNRYFPFAAAAIFALSAASCGNNAGTPVKNGTDTAVVVQTFSLSKGLLTTNMVLPGELRPFQSVDVYAKVNSFVKDIFVDVGSKVHRGQLLVTLEAPEMEDAVNTAASLLHTNEALYNASRANYGRLYHTSKVPGTISPNDLDMAYAKMGSDSANLMAAASRYREATAMTGYLEIRAPFDGVISSRNLYAGAYVGPAGKGSDKPLLVLQEQEKLRLTVSVPEAATAYFKLNDTVGFSVKSLPGQEFKASVSRLAGSLDLQLRTEQMEMDVINSNKQLLPGMYADVSLVLTNTAKEFIVPATSVTGNSQQVFVIRVANGKAEWVPVKKGREGAGTVEIFGALKEADQLVNNATDELKNGTAVTTESIVKR